jgi:hypothetical protein
MKEIKLFSRKRLLPKKAVLGILTEIGYISFVISCALLIAALLS